MGLAFVIGVLVFFAVFQMVKLWGSPRDEPLDPIDKRHAGSFQAPYFKASADAPDKIWKLQDQAGKVVVVNLFATWCGPCREELPELEALAREYQPRGVVFAMVSLDQDGDHPGKSRDEALREFEKAEAPPFPLLVPAADSILWKTAQVPIPQTFLYDKHSRSARVIVGSISGRNMKASLEELLKEQ
jgi:thiol-disulfide isomerase/thioredoxin